MVKTSEYGEYGLFEHLLFLCHGKDVFTSVSIHLCWFFFTALGTRKGRLNKRRASKLFRIVLAIYITI